MKTVEYLSQIERMTRQIENKTEEIIQLQQMITNISSHIEPDRIQTTHEPDKIGEAVAKIVDMQNEIKELVQKLIERRTLIISQIDGMDDVRHYNVLSKRFVGCKTFDCITDEMGINRRQVFRLYNKALGAFEKKYGEMYIESAKKI